MSQVPPSPLNDPSIEPKRRLFTIVVFDAVLTTAGVVAWLMKGQIIWVFLGGIVSVLTVGPAILEFVEAEKRASVLGLPQDDHHLAGEGLRAEGRDEAVIGEG